MKNSFGKILLGIEILAALLVLGAIYIWAPVCDALLTLENGNMVHMKCFYTAQATTVLAVLLLITAVIAFFAKKDQRKIQLIIIAIGVFMLINTVSSALGIGICKMETMACHETAFWIRLGSIVVILSAVVSMFVNKDQKNSLTL